MQELLLADGVGFFGIFNVFVEKPLYWKKLTQNEIINIQMDDSKYLFITTSSSVSVFRIQRGVKMQEVIAHTDAILKVIALDPVKIKHNANLHEPLIITTSLDNTIKLWKGLEMEAANTMEVPEKSGIWFC